jgi:hypothetical protein
VSGTLERLGPATDGPAARSPGDGALFAGAAPGSEAEHAGSSPIPEPTIKNLTKA